MSNYVPWETVDAIAYPSKMIYTYIYIYIYILTSWHGFFRITGPLCGGQKGLEMRNFDVFLVVIVNKVSNITLIWRHCNVNYVDFKNPGETETLSFWQHFRLWLHRKLSNDNFRCRQWLKCRQNPFQCCKSYPFRPLSISGVGPKTSVVCVRLMSSCSLILHKKCIAVIP